MAISTLRRRDYVKLYWETAPKDGPLTVHPAGVGTRPKGIVKRPWRGSPTLARADAAWRRGRTNEQIFQDSMRGKAAADPASISSIKLALRSTRREARRVAVERAALGAAV